MYAEISQALERRGFPAYASEQGAREFVTSYLAKAGPNEDDAIRLALDEVVQLATQKASAEQISYCEDLIKVSTLYLHSRADLRRMLAHNRLWREASERLSNIAFSRLVLTVTGIVEMNAMNPVRALECYVKALQLLETLPEEQRRIPASALYSNMGLNYMYAGMYHEAFQMLDRSRQAYGGHHANGLNNLAECCVYLGEVERGLEYCGLLETEQIPNVNHVSASVLESRTLTLSVKARLLVIAGQYELAANFAQQCLDLAFESGLERARLTARLAAVSALGFVGRRREAIEQLFLVAGDVHERPTFWGATMFASAKCMEACDRHADAARANAQLVKAISRNRALLLRERLAGGDRFCASPPESREAEVRSFAIAQVFYERSAREREQFEADLEQLDNICLSSSLTEDPSGRGRHRVAGLCQKLALAMTNDEHLASSLSIAGSLLDLGKSGVPDNILSAPRPLHPEEVEIVRSHVEQGLSLVSCVKVGEIPAVIQAIAEHHENWDGTGYPHGLAGEGISLAGRIAHVSDAFCAMLSDRPYREALGLPHAIELMKAGSGTIFDPDVVAALERLVIEQLGVLGSSDGFLASLDETNYRSPWVEASQALEIVLARIGY